MRNLIGGVRLAWHVLVAVFKLGVMARGWSAAQRRTQIAAWAKGVFTLLDIKLVINGAAHAEGGVLYAGNHVSWLDVYALLAAADLRFVAKAEVRDWPIAGWMAAQLGTHFITRGSRADAYAGATATSTFLKAGDNVCIFPEGSTTDGMTLRPFRAALFAPAAQGAAPLQPFAIRYRDEHGNVAQAAAFVGEMSLIGSLRTLLRHRGLTCELTFLSPIATATLCRRKLACAAEEAVKAELGIDVVAPVTRPAPQADTSAGELVIA